MSHPFFNGDQIEQRGESLYDHTIRALVETPENIGKIVSIDVETGEFEIGDDLVSTGKQMLARHPNAQLYAKRIGYNAVFAIGGTLTRTDA
ncbi:hypothetical protein [Gloeobacter morelensis]|uniref:Uncharacterized protein n=1 Tax=Gloeobacter morelensis MG652769 TaxID=2781736 RepID=A0ABY3PJ05_9CYAN|nr:hypothetical protein [Gloeobacter morelensis]UFP93621.1 hypothetical protein ISF26_17800 [Gloeobacter morelensis MG652769]